MRIEDRFDQVSEETLIARASKGDLEASNHLILTYQDRAYNHAWSMLNDRDLAEDVTQESFIKAFQAIGSFRGGSFRAWLLRIVTNTSYDLLRRSQRYPMQPLVPENDDGDEIESPAWLVDPSASVQNTVEQNEETRHIYRILNELPEAYRMVLTLIDLHEFDYTEAAQALNIPLGTVKSRLVRARLQMREKLRDYAFFQVPSQSFQSLSSGSGCEI
ncbi:MAG: sigma-70 family RNA polymerase sigma factor [Anaerolineales bacterium]|jgi:RNA polymerase sigma-70 factor (ECF subfamily)